MTLAFFVSVCNDVLGKQGELTGQIRYPSKTMHVVGYHSLDNYLTT